MVGEGGVDRRAADRAQDRRRLGGDLLAHHDSEARGDLRNQPRHHWRGKGGDPLSGDKARAVADRLGERGPNGEIAALERRSLRPPVRRARTLRRRRKQPPERSDPRLPRARSRRSSAEGWWSRSAVRAAAPPAPARLRRPRTPRRRAYGRGWLALPMRVQIERAQSELERAPERGLAHVRDHPPGRLRHGAAQHSDRTSDRVGQPLGEARPLEAGDRLPQVLGVLRRQPRRHVLDGRHDALKRGPFRASASRYGASRLCGQDPRRQTKAIIPRLMTPAAQQ